MTLMDLLKITCSAGPNFIAQLVRVLHGYRRSHERSSRIRHFTNINFCQFQASLGAKQCCSVTLCLVHQICSVLLPQRTGENKNCDMVPSYLKDCLKKNSENHSRSTSYWNLNFQNKHQTRNRRWTNICCVCMHRMELFSH